jgi:hypothetical protein
MRHPRSNDHRLGSLATVATLGLAACGQHAPSHQEPPDGTEPVFVSEIHQFERIDELVATSDLVVRARVLDARPGRTLGAGEEALYLRELTLEVDAAFDGAIERQPDGTLLVEEVEWIAAGGLYVPEDTLRLEAGDEALFFLWRKRDVEDPIYRLVNRQAVYPIEGGGLIATERRDPFIRQIEATPFSTIEQGIQRALARVADGSLLPADSPPVLSGPTTDED